MYVRDDPELDNSRLNSMGAKHINNRSLSENVIDIYMKLCPMFKHYNALNIKHFIPFCY